ncbi:MAG: hypothetical protein JW929_10795 [Anaerolineales bacterium]|nr:hypothetical protein [Anaerolineales bacterium]
MRESIIGLLKQSGPQTGAGLHQALGGEAFPLWKACLLSPALAVRRIGRRYLRLDRRVAGYLRLSPSILREFLTYTAVGLAKDPAALDRRARELHSTIQEISRKKRELATQILTEIAEPFAAGGEGQQPFCAVLAGDIVYEMAHAVDRPERSTGSMVCGSDLDIVVVVGDEAPDDLVARLDEAVYRKKYQYLKHPAFREEIDYVVKRFQKLREQSAFDTFERMLACKIFDESVRICGSPELFAQGKQLLRECGVVERLRSMEEAAARAREQQERQLLAAEENPTRDDLGLFYTDDESEEFE